MTMDGFGPLDLWWVQGGKWQNTQVLFVDWSFYPEKIKGLFLFPTGLLGIDNTSQPVEFLRLPEQKKLVIPPSLLLAVMDSYRRSWPREPKQMAKLLLRLIEVLGSRYGLPVVAQTVIQELTLVFQK